MQNPEKSTRIKDKSFLVMQGLFCTQDQAELLLTVAQINGKFNSTPIYRRMVRSFLISRD